MRRSAKSALKVDQSPRKGEESILLKKTLMTKENPPGKFHQGRVLSVASIAGKTTEKNVVKGRILKGVMAIEAGIGVKEEKMAIKETTRRG